MQKIIIKHQPELIEMKIDSQLLNINLENYWNENHFGKCN